MTDFERDVRSMLERRAADVTPSHDAWDRIQARLQADERPTAIVRRRPFQVVAGGAAAAAVAALVLGQVLPGSPTTQVADGTSTTVVEQPSFVRPDRPVVYPDPSMSRAPATDPVESAKQYLLARTGVEPSEPRVVLEEDAVAQLRFDDGPVFSEVWLTKHGDGWWVDSASSDLVPMHMLTYEGGSRITGEVVAEADGILRLSYRGADGEPVVDDEPRAVAFRDQVSLDQRMPGESYVVVRAVLELPDGTFTVSEAWAANPETGAVGPGAGEGVDTYQGVFPAYTGEELAGLEDSGDTTYHDPERTAQAFLDDFLQVDGTVGTFMQGDSLSGEVPFELADGARGLVLVRRASAEAKVWFVSYATTDGAPFDIRTEGGGTTVEPRDGISVDLAEMQPMPGGDVVTGEPADHLLRFEGVTSGIVKLLGTDAGGTTVFTVSRVSPAG